MKKSTLTSAFLFAGLFVFVITFSSCGNKKNDDKQQTESAEHHHEAGDSTNHDALAEMTHSCPMHPEEKGKEGDTCSKCAMKMEPVKETDQK